MPTMTSYTSNSYTYIVMMTSPILVPVTGTGQERRQAGRCCSAAGRAAKERRHGRISTARQVQAAAACAGMHQCSSLVCMPYSLSTSRHNCAKLSSHCIAWHDMPPDGQYQSPNLQMLDLDPGACLSSTSAGSWHDSLCACLAAGPASKLDPHAPRPWPHGRHTRWVHASAASWLLPAPGLPARPLWPATLCRSPPTAALC